MVMNDPPWLDPAVSWTLLQRTAAGTAVEMLRLSRPGRVVAFGPADRLRPGFDAACAEAERAGFVPLLRMAGGHAAVFHEETISFSWTVSDARAASTIHPRFATAATWISTALGRLGVDARIGMLVGEYCPGDYSVNARGCTKLAGLGQRILPRAACVSGVIVVDSADLVRDVLDPVYRALELEWDPATSGSVRAEAPGVTWDDVTVALMEAVAVDREVRPASLDPAVLAEARQHAPRFVTAGTVGQP
jgi:octanoyl-[GcvH]:protein N-octanoyltransferase